MNNIRIPRTTKLSIAPAGREPAPTQALDLAEINDPTADTRGATVLKLQRSGISVVSALTGQAVDGDIELSPYMRRILSMCGLGAAILHGRRPYSKNEEPVDARTLYLPRGYNALTGAVRSFDITMKTAHELFTLTTPTVSKALREQRGEGVTHESNRDLTQGLGHASLQLWATVLAEREQNDFTTEKDIQIKMKRDSAEIIAATRQCPELPTLMSLADPGSELGRQLAGSHQASVEERRAFRDLRDSEIELRRAIAPTPAA